jgi:hypothetical protein
MPKLTDTDGRSVEAMEEAIDEAADPIGAAAARRVGAKVDGPLKVYLRFKNNRVDYSFANRPDPTMSGVSDAVLMSAIIVAGRDFPFARLSKQSRSKAETKYVHRGTSSTKLAFKDRVSIDFKNGSITSTVKKHLALQALSIVVQNLAASAAKDAPEPEPAN